MEAYSPGRSSLGGGPRVATASGGCQQAASACVVSGSAKQAGRGRPKGASVEVPLTSMSRPSLSAIVSCAEASMQLNAASAEAQSARAESCQQRVESSPKNSRSLSLRGSLSTPVLPGSLSFGAAGQRWPANVAPPGATGQAPRMRAGEDGSSGTSNTSSMAFGAVLSSACPASIMANYDQSQCPSPKVKGRESGHTSGTATPTGRTVEGAELPALLHHHSDQEGQNDVLSTSHGSLPGGPVLYVPDQPGGGSVVEYVSEQPGSGSAPRQTNSSLLANRKLALVQHTLALPPVQISSVQALSGPPSARLSSIVSPKACVDCSQRGSSAPERRLVAPAALGPPQAAPLRPASRGPQSGNRSPPQELHPQRPERASSPQQHERPFSPQQAQRLQLMQQLQQQQQPTDQQQQQLQPRSASETHKEAPMPQSGEQVLPGGVIGRFASSFAEVVEDSSSDLRASLSFAKSMVEWRDFGNLADEIRQEFRAMQQGLQMLETMFGDELRTCKEAIRCEASQREETCADLEGSFKEALEEEAEKRQSIESRMDARLGTVHADISARLNDELSATIDELHAALTERWTTRDESEVVRRGTSMSSLEERPEQELLERLGEAVEAEAAARRALESRLQMQLEKFASELRETLPHNDQQGRNIDANRGQQPWHSCEEQPQHQKHTAPHAASAKGITGSSGTGGTGNVSGDELSSMLPVFLKDLMSWDSSAEENKRWANSEPDPGSWHAPQPQRVESSQTRPVLREERCLAQACSAEAACRQEQKSKSSGPMDSWEVKAIQEAVCELRDALQDGLRREADARAKALAVVQAPEIGAIVSEQDLLFKAVANLDSKIGTMQRDLHSTVQQMSQQTAETMCELWASKGQEAFQAASKVLSMSGLPASSSEKPVHGC